MQELRNTFPNEAHFMGGAAAPVFIALPVEAALFHGPLFFPVPGVRTGAGKAVEQSLWQRLAAAGIVGTCDVLLSSGSCPTASGSHKAIVPGQRDPNDDVLLVNACPVTKTNINKGRQPGDVSQQSFIISAVVYRDRNDTDIGIFQRALQPFCLGTLPDPRRFSQRGTVIKKIVVTFHSAPPSMPAHGRPNRQAPYRSQGQSRVRRVR